MCPPAHMCWKKKSVTFSTSTSYKHAIIRGPMRSIEFHNFNSFTCTFNKAFNSDAFWKVKRPAEHIFCCKSIALPSISFFSFRNFILLNQVQWKSFKKSKEILPFWVTHEMHAYLMVGSVISLISVYVNLCYVASSPKEYLDSIFWQYWDPYLVY